MGRLLAAALTFMAATAANAQVGQFPQVPPPVPGPGIAGAPPPLLVAPPPPRLPDSYGPPTTVLVPGYRPVHVPGAPRNRNSYSDRIERCIHAGTSAGIRPNRMGSFSVQCAN